MTTKQLIEASNRLAPTDFSRLCIRLRSQREGWDYKEQAHELFTAGCIASPKLTRQAIWSAWGVFDKKMDMILKSYK